MHPLVWRHSAVREVVPVATIMPVYYRGWPIPMQYRDHYLYLLWRNLIHATPIYITHTLTCSISIAPICAYTWRVQYHRLLVK